MPEILNLSQLMSWELQLQSCNSSQLPLPLSCPGAYVDCCTCDTKQTSLLHFLPCHLSEKQRMLFPFKNKKCPRTRQASMLSCATTTNGLYVCCSYCLTNNIFMSASLVEHRESAQREQQKSNTNGHLLTYFGIVMKWSGEWRPKLPQQGALCEGAG